MIDFKGHRVEKDIILLCVRWYLAYPLSYRNLEDMMEERGVQVDHSKHLPLGPEVYAALGGCLSEWQEAPRGQRLADGRNLYQGRVEVPVSGCRQGRLDH
jgi:hypothetical protein